MNKPHASEADRALVTGGTGLVGGALLRRLGGSAVATTRDPGRVRALPGAATIVGWDAASPLPAVALEGVRTVFHLAGEPVAEGRWTDAKKARIRASRVDSTRAIVDAIAAREPARRPRVLVCASAVGIYGSRGDAVLDEDAPPAAGFLAEVCRAWEAEAERARSSGLRVVSLRLGIVLARDGGALPRMLPPFRLGLGARLGYGGQWMPWVHLEDVVGLCCAAADDTGFAGPVNAVAPTPVTNADFTATLARVLGRPAFLGAPRAALRVVLGEAADVVLASQRTVPQRALAAGYRFAFPELEPALRDLVAPDAPPSAVRRHEIPA